MYHKSPRIATSMPRDVRDSYLRTLNVHIKLDLYIHLYLGTSSSILPKKLKEKDLLNRETIPNEIMEF